MSRSFILVAQGGTAKLQDLVSNRIKAAGYGYWHWMQNFWIVTGLEAGVTPKTFSEWLEQTPGVGQLTYLVLDTDSADYWGRNNAQAWDWLSRNWKR